jgi:hypothetical protein
MSEDLSAQLKRLMLCPKLVANADATKEPLKRKAFVPRNGFRTRYPHLSLLPARNPDHAVLVRPTTPRP